MKHKEYFGQCGYHWGTHVPGLRAVQLTPDGGKEWQHAIAMCDKCRGHMTGFFRYAKSMNSQYTRVK